MVDTPRGVVLFELNEVPFRVLDEHCRRHPEGALAQMLPDCDQYETWAEDSVLSPWITWPTVHRGVTDERHHIRHLGQDVGDADDRWPPLWRVVAAAGTSAAVFGSLHSYPVPPERKSYAFYVPDAFAPDAGCHPEPLAAFQRLNLTMSRRSARNVDASVPWAEGAALLARAPGLGLRFRTLADAVRQVAEERVRPWRRTRRRTYQALLGFDLFLAQLQRRRPAFATFFTNHVASAMHRYWAAAFPADYARNAYEADWKERFAGEIDFAMRRTDHLLARLLRFARRNPGYELWIASSMGQSATTAAPQHSQVYLTDLGGFMCALGVPDGAWSERPSMAPEVSLFVEPTRAAAFRAALRELRVAGQPVDFDEPRPGFFGLSLGQADLEEPVAERAGRVVPLASLGLSRVPIEDGSNTNAYHVREGVLLIHRSRPSPRRGRRERVSTVEIAPAVLRALGLPRPPYMAEPRIAAG